MVSQINAYKLLANLVYRGLVLLCHYMTQSVTYHTQYHTQYLRLTCDDDLLCLQQHKLRSQFSRLLSSSLDLSHFKQTPEFNARTWILTKRNQRKIHTLYTKFFYKFRRRNKKEQSRKLNF